MSGAQHRNKLPKTRPTASAPAGMQRRLLFRFLAIVLPILAIEAAARTYWSVLHFKPLSESEVFWDEAAERSHSDDVPPYSFLPDMSFSIAGTQATTNNLGLRGQPNVDLDTPYSGTRILCLGDSVTFGYAVTDDSAAYPAALERQLRGQGIDCQVLNAGFPRYRLQHLAIYLEQNIVQFDPDVVIVLGGWNNINDQLMRSGGLDTTLQWLGRHCYAFRVLKSWDLVAEPEQFRHDPAIFSDQGLEKYAAALQKIVKVARANAAEVYLCTLPHFFLNVNSPEAEQKAAKFCPPGTLEQLIAAIAMLDATAQELTAQENVHLIDLSSVNSPELFEDAAHPGNSGSAAIATIVAKNLYPE